MPVCRNKRLILCLTAAICFIVGLSHADQNLRIGFSRAVIGDVNENDALAVIRVWSKALVITENLSVDPQSNVFPDISSIEAALKRKQVEMICITAKEYPRVEHLMDRDKFILPVCQGRMTEAYVLVVRKESAVADIKDLKGSLLKFSNHSRTTLSIIWLDIELARAGLPAAEKFFTRMDPVKNVSTAVLPVFFKNADACLVTRKGFEAMAELNPQIEQQLKILVVSGEYVPNFLGFRADYRNEIKDIIFKKIETWDKTASGQQILTIFQTDGLKARSSADLTGTMALLAEHHRLLGADTPESRGRATTLSEKYK